MNEYEINKIKKLESFYWWHIARRELAISLIKKYLPKDITLTILDLGCGTGEFLGELSSFGQLNGIDISPCAVKLCQERGLKHVYQEDIVNLQFSPELFDLVTALDIFEHIEDDKKAFSESRRVLKKKGTLLLTVPANSCLWSHHDIALSHKRRYALSELKRKLVLSGFKIERISYCIFFLFLPIFLFRMVQKIYFEVSLFPPKTVYLIFPKFINTVFLWLCELENLLIKIGVNFPFGVSIVCVATKN